MGFSYAAVYQAEAVCRTPLRTGGRDGDMEQVLRRRDGTAFIQGTSLAGAMREWLQGRPEGDMAEALFGSQGRPGRLTVSDALFDRRADRYTRPRLRIDAVSATGYGRSKFDVAHMGTGSRLEFTLVWRGEPEQKGELETVKKLLGAINSGDIRFGGQKSNGFGALSLTVRSREFDMKEEAARRAWLADDWAGRPLELPGAADSGRVRFTVTGRTGSILVKTAPVVGQGRDGRTRIPNLSENGESILPGSSVKGAVRARAAYIEGALGLGERITERYFGRMARDGDSGLPGQVYFDDCVLSGPKRTIRRIHIDRFTGGVWRQGLFAEEPLSSDITLTVTAPEAPELCALLVYALRDLGLGLYHLGSGWGIGRGGIEVDRIAVSAPGGKEAALVFDREGNITLEDEQGLVKEWLDRLEEARHV